MPKSHRPYPVEFQQRLIELVRKGRTPEGAGAAVRALRAGDPGWVKQAARVSVRARADVELGAQIATIHRESRGTYGAPRVHAELAAQGIRVGRKRVARLMRQAKGELSWAACSTCSRWGLASR